MSELPFLDIAKLMNLSKGRVSQIHIDALQSLRTLLKKKERMERSC